jgi:hypothetical protein
MSAIDRQTTVSRHGAGEAFGMLVFLFAVFG